MPGTAVQPSLSVDPFATFLIPIQETYSDLSPVSLFDPLDDLNFTSDSAPSLGSPLSPALSASSYVLPAADNWIAWDKIEHSPEPFDGALLSPPPLRSYTLSPAVNPMDLTMQGVEGPAFSGAPTNEHASQIQLAENPLAADPTEPLGKQTPANDQCPAAAQPSIAKGSVKQQTAQDLHEPSKRCRSPNLKRKSWSPNSDEEDSRTQQSPPSSPPAARRSRSLSREKDLPAPKKTAHNMIEKRYRTNLNDRIVQLRDSVPALRIIAHRLEHASREGNADDESIGAAGEEDDLGGLAPASKLNKATILSKATEYIAHLESKNSELEIENAALREKMEGLERLLMRHGRLGGVFN
ncbi:putative helix-loop-helix DNA-binding domain-protein [Diplogelasinospora grovesii]|uniref:Helix-loop-helix DNA-binding domain-protein n=1 Tax=Diplogelasinospora grovesii TaxID=303347 RepID=A0AAN6N1T7_9PEZI|nr:putative helix-loop-helix DNA-binding domain-protein [Diplogelasinospora grovesii]